MESTEIRVLCVDDHRIVREGIALIIGRQPDMTVVGSAATGEEAVALFERHRPDITLMDLQLGSMSGVEAIRAIRQQDAAARIVVLTMYHGDEDIHRALEAGAAAYLLKDTLSDDLIRVVREVHAGREPLISSDVQAHLAERASRPQLTPPRGAGDRAHFLWHAEQGNRGRARNQRGNGAGAREEYPGETRTCRTGPPP